MTIVAWRRFVVVGTLGCGLCVPRTRRLIACIAAGLGVLTTLRAVSLLRELEGTTAALLVREADLSHRASTDALTGLRTGTGCTSG